MTPLDRVRLEKAATDCGLEMTPVLTGDVLQLRSATFPETVRVTLMGPKTFSLQTEVPGLFDHPGVTSTEVQGFGALYEALRGFVGRARTRPNRVADTFKKKTQSLPQTTEAERWVVQRVGQGLFREALMTYWQGRCCITGLDLSSVLRASHIKPWAVCQSVEERLDVFNGLLLAPHLDALFDRGWMSLDESGQVVWSPALTESHKQILGLSASLVCAGLRPEHQPYLAYHREKVFTKAAAASEPPPS